MHTLAPSLLVAVMALLLAVGTQGKKPYISTAAEITTECKTCPRSLCPNKVIFTGGFDGQDPLNVTCWTHGTKIMGDRVWLKSEAGCYVTQYDLREYDGEYETDLAYCGPESEKQDITIQGNTLRYKTECRIGPFLTDETVWYLSEDTDVDLTCWYPDGQVILDDPIWLKTTNNCYVAQKNLYSKPDITYLEACGPSGHLEYVDHHNENDTSDVNKRDPQTEAVAFPISGPHNKRYLINVTVGEEYARCYSCPKTNCTVEKVYDFDQEVVFQCITNAYTVNGTWWAQTTDFCYVVETDFWQSIVGDFYRNPLCKYFPGGWGAGPDPTLPGSDNGDGT